MSDNHTICIDGSPLAPFVLSTKNESAALALTTAPNNRTHDFAHLPSQDRIEDSYQAYPGRSKKKLAIT